jgi:methionine-rich copper-binding protein CopC
MKKRVLLVLAVALGAVLIVPVAQVFAHAEYDHSTPNAGETVTTVPTQVDVYFSQAVDPEGAIGLNVTSAGGADVDNNDSALDPADATHMTVTLQANLANGLYTVAWNTVSAEDGDAADGTFTFAIDAAQATPQATTTAAASPAATVAAGKQLPSSGTGDGLGGGGNAWFAVLAAVAVMGGGLAWLGARRLGRRA